MLRNTAFLLGQVKAAAAALKGGVSFSGSDESQLWGVSTQSIKGRLTGKIVVACADSASLTELRTELQKLGHAVEDGRNVSTGDPVPDTIEITPGN
jgi:hypothetical protein